MHGREVFWSAGKARGASRTLPLRNGHKKAMSDEQSPSDSVVGTPAAKRPASAVDCRVSAPKLRPSVSRFREKASPQWRIIRSAPRRVRARFLPISPSIAGRSPWLTSITHRVTGVGADLGRGRAGLVAGVHLQRAGRLCRLSTPSADTPLGACWCCSASPGRWSFTFSTASGIWPGTSAMASTSAGRTQQRDHPAAFVLVGAVAIFALVWTGHGGYLQ